MLISVMFITFRHKFNDSIRLNTISCSRNTLNRKIEWAHDTENPLWSLYGGELLKNNTPVQRLAAAASSLPKNIMMEEYI